MKYHDHHINGILICVDRGPVHRHMNSYFQPAEVCVIGLALPFS